MNKLWGNRLDFFINIRFEMFDANESAEKIIKTYEAEVAKFEEIRKDQLFGIYCINSHYKFDFEET